SYMVTKELGENMGFSATQVQRLQLFLKDVRVSHWRHSLRESRESNGPLPVPKMGFEKADPSGKYQDRWWYEYGGRRHYRDGDYIPSANSFEDLLEMIAMTLYG
ncbi:hypothetical protein PtrEW13061_005492, partial [Pyrenophora tritici-repentis]